jgi:hypothetical protein
VSIKRELVEVEEGSLEEEEEKEAKPRPARAKTEEEEEEEGAVRLDEFEPQRLERGRSAQTEVNLYNARRIDLDGDGIEELVATMHSGGLGVFRPGEPRPEVIKLEKLSGSTSISDFEPARDVSGVGWFVATQTHSGFFRRSVKAKLSLHDPDGKMEWSYELQSPAASASPSFSLSMAELDGEGLPEFIACIIWHIMKPTGENSWSSSGNQTAQIVVLDAAGKPVAIRRLGTGYYQMSVVPGTLGRPGSILVTNQRGSAAAYTLKPSATPAASRPAGG